MIDLDGQVALVSGGSRGIGAAICRALAGAGAKVAVNYRTSEAAARELCEAIEARGGQARAFAADVSEAAQVEALVESVTEAWGPVNVLVHNAGLQHSAMAHRMRDEQWHAALGVNLHAAFYLARAVLPAMRTAESGSIVFIASASGSIAQAGAAGYVAAKHGLIGLTKALALESARKGIRVNAVSPGLTDTDLVAELSPEQRAGLLGMVPLGRMATPDEVAATVEWVVRGASYSTGNVFHVGGGVAMG
ncbi:3-oxoacyl-[acyl-carrier-protein] reductase FabG [Enhygromyxa salina]|uniref:3-oxoacyl-[acyl-carrier-protein] reductase FabG n=1 Tax=Enhygromyxa salina TaxID=215803 RepID=A0A2S9XKH8_9BACT|nr:SDR family NAD(P)-dependent oxidoreductase [Enhygromyxa salina]PRP93389.1 3-oxoacyl-[acyl-carrier-protein] reductase FabG [Enhygromyxa salina]